MIAPAVLALALWFPQSVQPVADGAWRAEYKMSRGRSHTFTLILKTSDRTLSGTISSPRGSVNITEGTIDGRNVTLKVNRRANYDEIPVTYTGTIDGDVMRLSMRVGAREPIPVTARREGPGPAVPGDK
jgi:hypothetical protein